MKRRFEMNKKLTAILLCAAMVLSMIPAAAFADDEPAMNEYSFIYHNDDYRPFDSPQSNYRTYLQNNFRSRFVQNDSESAYVIFSYEGYTISVTCEETISYADLLGYNGVLSNVYSANNLKEPPVYIGAGARESVDDYSSWEDFNTERFSTDPIPLTGAEFYMLEGSTINSVDISADAPVCGTEIKMAEGSLSGVPEEPVPVTFPEGSKYHVNAMGGFPRSVWAEGEATGMDALQPFYGTIQGDTEYKLVVNLEPDFGYVFNDTIGKSDALINGEEALLLNTQEDELWLVVVGAVTAVHDWDEGKVTKEPTLKEDGEMTYTCKHCDSVKTEKLDKLNANTLKVSGKTASVKYSKLKKKSQTLKAAKVLKFADKGQGKLTYKRTKGNKKISISKTTGKVTVKKGLKKGKYKVTVSVTAAGDSTHASLTRKVTFTVKVK